VSLWQTAASGLPSWQAKRAERCENAAKISKKRAARWAWNVLWWVVLHMRTLRFYPTLSALALATMASTAYAQTAPMTTVQPALTRLNKDGSAAPTRPNVDLKVITFEDCVEDRNYKIVLNTPSVPDARYTLQGWAGTAECLSNLARRGTAGTQTCWKAIADLGQNGTATVTARVRDIVANDVTQKENYVNVQTADKCASLNKANVTLNFMWVQSGTDPGVPATGNPVFSVDTTGPAAPTGLKVSEGETLLIASWDAPKSVSDLTGYRLYCEEIPDGTVIDGPDASTPANDAANDVGTTLDASAADADSSDAATVTDASPADAAVGAADAGTVDASTATAPDPNCPSKLLIAGASPPGSLTPCASSQGQIGSQQNITGLKNGARYAIAVAAINKNGNSSPLSNVVCGVPIEVDTFFDQYKQAGGGAGGCSTSGETPSLVALGVALTVALSSLRKRRQS
jgi:hypothetical protein